jgi:hypothetical protein
LKRIHGQGTSGQDTGVKLVEVVSPAVKTERNESDHELSSDDDIERYDPSNLIGEVSDSVDEDTFHAIHLCYLMGNFCEKRMIEKSSAIYNVGI